MMSSLKSIILSCLFLIILSQKTCQDYCQPNGCNCYKVLNVATWAEPSEIKKSYRALTQHYRSDANPEKDASAKFAEIANCYEIFKDERSRAEYDWCIEKGYNYISYEPKNNNDWFWALPMPIFEFFRKRSQQREGQNNQKGNNILKGIGIFVACVLALVLFAINAPDFIIEPFMLLIETNLVWIVDNYFFLNLTCYLTLMTIFLTLEKIFSLFGESPNEKEINNFFSDLRNAIDQFNGKILQKANEKKRIQENEMSQAKNQELANFERSHHENLAFIQQPENQEDELAKIHKRNIELCESRSEKKSRQANEAFNKFIESHNKTCEYYKKLASDTEKEMRLL